jgi:molybdopterin/thiamine biosynthesis adenylyltransferase
MNYALSAAWVVRSRHPLVLSSESTELAIRVSQNRVDELVALLSGWSAGIAPDLEPLRSELIGRGVLRAQVSNQPGLQERQIEYWRSFTDAAERAVGLLEASRIAIAGCGGVGTVVLQHLVGAGVRHFRLIDSDAVEESNLNRQFVYNRSSVGSLKVEQARAYVTAQVPEAQIETIAEAWDETQAHHQSFLFEDVDVVLAAIDHPSIDASVRLLDAAWSRGIPAIMATVGLERSLVSAMFVAGVSDQAPREVLKVGRQPEGPRFTASFGPTNTIAATVAADQIIHHVAGLRERVDYNRSVVITRSTDGAPRSTRVNVVRL